MISYSARTGLEGFFGSLFGSSGHRVQASPGYVHFYTTGMQNLVTTEARTEATGVLSRNLNDLILGIIAESKHVESAPAYFV